MSRQEYALLTTAQALSATIGERRFVTFAGDQVFSASATLGVAIDAGNTGDTVSVRVIGTAYVETGDALAIGDAIEPDSAGRAIPLDSGGQCARALESASGAGEVIEVLLLPQ